MTGSLLIHQVCRNHASREAVGRCQECTSFYCRECLTEHGGRLLCAACLAQVAQPVVTVPRVWPRLLGSGVGATLGFLAAWLCFYSLGHLLLTLPSAFHADSLWERTMSTLHRDE